MKMQTCHQFAPENEYRQPKLRLPKEVEVKMVRAEFGRYVASQVPLTEREWEDGSSEMRIVAHVYTEEEMSKIHIAMSDLMDAATLEQMNIIRALRNALDH